MKDSILKSHDGATWRPGKVSEMMLEFSQPVLELDGGPPDIKALRNILQVVMLCWNLPALQAQGRPAAEEMRSGLEQGLARMPDRVRSAFTRLLEDRRTKFGSIPFLVLLRVEGTSLDNARLIAEARMP